jgi:hypothetical protein
VVRYLAILLIAAVPLAAQQQPETARINAERVNVRKAPSLDSAIVRTLSKGTVVTVLFRDSSWAKIELSELSLTGWVRENLLTPLTTAAATAKVDATPAAVVPAAPPPPPPPSAAAPATADPLAGAPVPTTASAPAAAASATPQTPSATTVVLWGGLDRLQATASGGGETETGDWNNGLALGFAVIVPTGGPMSIEVLAGYSRFNSSSTDQFGDVTSGTDNFANAAFFLRPAFGQPSARFYLLLGPQVNFLVSCSATYTTVSSSTISGCSPGGNSRLDFGVVVGAGIQFGRIMLEARYDYGIKDLSDFTGVTERSRYMFIGAGVAF